MYRGFGSFNAALGVVRRRLDMLGYHIHSLL
jgi:hypothetical protein